MSMSARYILSVYILIFISLSACSRNDRINSLPLSHEKINAEASETLTLATPTTQPIISFTATSTSPTFTLDPSPIYTRTFVPSLSPSPTKITATALSTLNHAEKDRYFRQALEGSKDCRWPCFGGVIPGITTSAEAIRILGTFVLWGEGGSNQYKNWFYKFQSTNDSYEGNIHPDNRGILGSLLVSTDLRTNILKVSYVLKAYGTPSEIYIHPNAIGPGDIGLLQLVMVYQEQKAILYYEWDEKQVGNSVIAYDALLSHNSLMALTLIGEKDFSWTPEAIAHAVIPYITKPTLTPLHDISKMTIEQFSRAFIDPNTTQNIIIPLSTIQ